MSDLVLVRLNPKLHRAALYELTLEYYKWLNDEYIRAFQLSIPDFVGMPLNSHVKSTIELLFSDLSHENIFYILKCDNHFVGFGGLRRLPDGSAEIVRIYVSPQFRNRSFGKELMNRLLVDARNIGYKTVKLDTGPFMHPAHKIYKSLGFTDCPPYDGAKPPTQVIPFWRYMSKSVI